MRAPPDGRSAGSSPRASRGLFSGVAMVTGLVSNPVGIRVLIIHKNKQHYIRVYYFS